MISSVAEGILARKIAQAKTQKTSAESNYSPFNKICKHCNALASQSGVTFKIPIIRVCSPRLHRQRHAPGAFRVTQQTEKMIIFTSKALPPCGHAARPQQVEPSILAVTSTCGISLHLIISCHISSCFGC